MDGMRQIECKDLFFTYTTNIYLELKYATCDHRSQGITEIRHFKQFTVQKAISNLGT